MLWNDHPGCLLNCFYHEGLKTESLNIIHILLTCLKPPKFTQSSLPTFPRMAYNMHQHVSCFRPLEILSSMTDAARFAHECISHFSMLTKYFNQQLRTESVWMARPFRQYLCLKLWTGCNRKVFIAWNDQRGSSFRTLADLELLYQPYHAIPATLPIVLFRLTVW